MWPDRVSNLGPGALESDTLPTALRGPAVSIKENGYTHRGSNFTIPYPLFSRGPLTEKQFFSFKSRSHFKEVHYPVKQIQDTRNSYKII